MEREASAEPVDELTGGKSETEIERLLHRRESLLTVLKDMVPADVWSAEMAEVDAKLAELESVATELGGG